MISTLPFVSVKMGARKLEPREINIFFVGVGVGARKLEPREYRFEVREN